MFTYYDSDSEEAFQNKLLEQQQVYIQLYYNDDSIQLERWQIKAFSTSSSLHHNLTSGCLRSWSQKGIRHAVLSPDKEKLHYLTTAGFIWFLPV